ncbi:MAG: alpha/beta fold hydrolase [Myxococcota bacterium]
MSGSPRRFGAPDRRLYGTYHAATGRGRGGLAAVICNPWGAEALRAHRSLRVLAETLARSRYHVLRFDYFGTGDSDGGLTDGSVAGWVSDIASAASELRALSGASRVVLVGLRLGGALATLAAQQDPDVDGVVLWDPVCSGSAWLQDLLGPAADASRGVAEVDGLPLTETLRADIASITPARLASPTDHPGLRRVLALTTTPAPGQAELRRLLAPAATHFQWDAVAAPVAWVEHGFFGPGPIAAPVIQRIAAWSGR